MTLPPPRPGVRPLEFGDRADAVGWILAERHLVPELVRALGQDPRGESFRRLLTSAPETCLDSPRF
ncbi:hypothetical protein ABZT06_46240 [Streptomyces sp. NPDC005483]|uniref:hypothetical protein n=1 Tax=Streptomyces sp. NPDC005483 TaxID=3154882 RepID=UPI00339ECBF5